MKYVVAVSGGVDSVVLLDVLVQMDEHDLVVAHFDHGIRGDESAADARFVEALAKGYGLPCYVGKGELSKDASEAEAREKRYMFLFEIARELEAILVTAHHANDCIETIAINCRRGTGWRGLAVLSDKRIYRPLLEKTKSELYAYALENNLEWVEDVTNYSDRYLRNRLRRQLGQIDASSSEVLRELRSSQLALANNIDSEVEQLIAAEVGTSRYFFISIDEASALEILRKLTRQKLTRPQLRRMLLAIKTYPVGAILEVGAGIQVRFTAREFIVENTSEVL
jgi:tRNA(Ile)-lysidine synthase